MLHPPKKRSPPDDGWNFAGLLTLRAKPLVFCPRGSGNGNNLSKSGWWMQFTMCAVFQRATNHSKRKCQSKPSALVSATANQPTYAVAVIGVVVLLSRRSTVPPTLQTRIRRAYHIPLQPNVRFTFQGAFQ